MANRVARGGIRLGTPANPGLTLGLEIFSDKIQFFNPATGERFDTLRAAAKVTALPLAGFGCLILEDWPLTTTDKVVDVTLTAVALSASAENFTLRIRQATRFGILPESEFSNLDFTLRFATGNAPAVEPGGQLQWNAHGSTINLQPVLASGELVFQSTSATPLNMDGSATWKAQGSVEPQPTQFSEGLAFLYLFGERAGGTVSDYANNGAGMTLEAYGVPSAGGGSHQQKTHAVWTPSGITMGRTYHLRNTTSSALADMLRSPTGFSFEVWLKSTPFLQDGPAPIFSLRDSGGRVYFSLAQGRAGSNANFLRVDLPQSGQATWSAPLLTPTQLEAGALTQVIFSRDVDGTESLYLNGKLVAERTRSFSLEYWPTQMSLYLGSDRANDADTDMWSGDLNHLAFYSQPMDATRVMRHYRPAFSAHGVVNLARVPSTLAAHAFPTVMEISEEETTLMGNDTYQVPIRPHLSLEAFHLDFTKHPGESWNLGGAVHTRLWSGYCWLEMDAGGFSLTNDAEEGDSTLLHDLGEVWLGGVNLRPNAALNDWELTSAPFMPFTALPAFLPDDVAVDGDFKLVQPVVGIDAQDILLQGSWLSRPLTLRFVSEAGQQVMKGHLTVDLPFSADLPPITDPGTGAEVFAGIRLTGETMHIEMDITLRAAGFHCTLTAGFAFTDAEGASQQITLPAQTLYLPPISLNALLGSLIDLARRQADQLFTQQGRHSADYFLRQGAQGLELVFASTAGAAVTHNTTLPLVLTAPATLSSPNGMITLEQTTEGARLQVNAGTAATAEVRAEHAAFMQALRASTITPGGYELVNQRLAERLPATFDDLLRYHHGWQPEAGWLDLSPGMRLRFYPQQYQFVQASDTSAERGFVSGGSFVLQVNSYQHRLNDGSAQRLLGFDAFASRLVMSSQADIINSGAGTVYDLLREGNRKPFYRMFFPQQPGNAPGPERVVTIIGTETASEMELATADFNPDGNLLPAVGTSFYFKGKVAVVPEIQIFVGNRAVWVPLGTTVRQLAEQADHVPATGLAGQDLRAFAGSSRALRRVHEGVSSTSLYRFINLNLSGTGTAQDVLDMPVLKGDRYHL